jgi:hypothetical protein
MPRNPDRKEIGTDWSDFAELFKEPIALSFEPLLMYNRFETIQAIFD